MPVLDWSARRPKLPLVFASHSSPRFPPIKRLPIMNHNTPFRWAGVLSAAMIALAPLAQGVETSTNMPAWLEHSVFYEIYTQSFRDSNGDGIGDLRGITEELPYLHDLGITGIWLNPYFESPFRDSGY